LADLERAERLDLVLRAAVPDRIRPPQDPLLAEISEQLAHHMGGLLRPSHEVAPERAHLRIEIALIALQPGVLVRLDQPVDTLRILRIVGPFRPPALEAAMIDEEGEIGIGD